MRNRSRFACALLLAIAACDGGSSSGDDDDSTGDDDTGDDDGTSPDADPGAADKFSFFVTSLAALQDLSGSEDGFGGDLRFGETGPGAGLRGADKICATIAERSLPGAGAKTWRAFLSATADENGDPVNAIDRIGQGPWYDRLGRLLAPSLDDMMGIRPANGDATIQDDFPNEDGVPNHQPDPTQAEVDNHDMLTGTGLDGTLYAADATCLDWTASAGDTESEGKPRVGHSWPRSGPGPGGGGGGDNTMNSWMSSLTESGCAPGINLIETGPPDPDDNTVGSGGGYGGFYCLALEH